MDQGPEADITMLSVLIILLSRGHNEVSALGHRQGGTLDGHCPRLTPSLDLGPGIGRLLLATWCSLEAAPHTAGPFCTLHGSPEKSSPVLGRPLTPEGSRGFKVSGRVSAVG